jgi:PIN domain nuclease of toxin-antitoxin system
VTLLDAYALIALILGEPAMEQVLGILREGRAAMTTVNLAETLDVSVRRHGLLRSRVAAVIEPLFEGSIIALAVDMRLAHRAAKLRGDHYHRSRRPLSLADAILLAAARPGTDRIATADRDVLAVAAEIGIETVELRDRG